MRKRLAISHQLSAFGVRRSGIGDRLFSSSADPRPLAPGPPRKDSNAIRFVIEGW
jgi:hypothetical protein